MLCVGCLSKKSVLYGFCMRCWHTLPLSFRNSYEEKLLGLREAALSILSGNPPIVGGINGDE